MQDDYIEEDFLEEENSSNRRPFLMAVGVLVTLFILMGACTAIFLVSNRTAQDRDAEVAAIETRNAETLDANAATAIAATDTAASAPTDTPVPTTSPTETSAPATPTPTNTPVVDNTTDEGATIETENDNDAVDDDAESDGSANENDSENSTDESTTVNDDASPTPISALSETSDGSNEEALPQTGLDSWGIVLAAFVLVGLLIFARRLRTIG
ncbi:MAG: hypothetical protein DHS20C20_32240 [Ardenticatenaceae bacterium]|nr:MAG: hypothetical protein DHS20C20_32240 [Ardenticatenaceae bacterium]